MFNIQKIKIQTVVTAVVFAMSALGSASGWTQTPSVKPGDSQKDGLKKAQQEKDFEHQLLQSDGVNHPLEIVKRGDAAKKAPVNKVAKPATQRDLDLEHNMAQTDGTKHPREMVKSGEAAKKAPVNKVAKPVTQRDLDLEHNMAQTDGINHPREMLKK